MCRSSQIARLRALIPCLFLLLGGCYKDLVIPTTELVHLDGYDVHNERSVPMIVGTSTYKSPASGTTLSSPIVGNVPVTDRPYRLLTTTGVPLDFNSTIPLMLETRSGARQGGKFERILVQQGAFSGRTLVEGQSVELRLDDIQAGHVRVPDGRRAFWAIFGVTAGVIAVTAIGLGASFASSMSSR